MKFRLIAVFLILFVAAWLPIIAQQSPSSQPAAQQPAPPLATDPGKAADKPGCCCSGHQNDNSAGAHCCQGKNANANGPSSCCHGKNAEAMACCKKEGQDKQATETCCKGKGDQMCAKQGGKGCCDSSACKSCGDKNATAANSTQSCCPATDCCHHNSKA